MNKAEVIEAVARNLGSSRAEAERALGAVTDAISEGLMKDHDVAILGFGTFRRSVRKARTGINPATKEKIQIPESVGVTFRAGKALKDRL
ncbi:MAG: HU family DNA-binding protein [Planctomycetota bacterium]|nr:HU family DNA-binding protein [Planctomycetota bacterium]MCB9825893.1 HU family DNA-binding protein [Planctomycetota bacterium]MCB9901292.1 HU family DNA-binding protein [Planctomycetota bacterium]